MLYNYLACFIYQNSVPWYYIPIKYASTGYLYALNHSIGCMKLWLCFSDALVAETEPETLTKGSSNWLLTRVIVNSIIMGVWVEVYNPTEVK